MNSAFEVPIVKRLEPASGHVELLVDSPVLAQGKPGQFCHILTPGTLRRPVSFSRLEPSTGLAGLLIQVVGSGTRWLSDRQVGDTLDVLGPLGRGFAPPRLDRPWLLVGGGTGIPPIYAALQAWRDQVSEPVAVVLGAKTRDALIMVKDVRQLGFEAELTTDDGSQGRFGTVMAPVQEWLAAHPRSQVWACGPTPMLRALHGATQGLSGPVQLALEQRMGCGIGACLACVVPAQPESPDGPAYRRVCTDGPVFEREELAF